MKESEDKKKKFDADHEDDEYTLPDMKDVLVQTRVADDNELLITEDEDDKKHKHGKKESKGHSISLADAMSYSETMADQSNGVHGYQTERRPMVSQKQQKT